MSEKVRNKIFSGFAWKSMERIMSQGVSFILSILLARLLSPEDYGTIALVIIFINIASVFVSSGFGEALIQKKNAGEKEYSTIFYLCTLISILLYILIFFFAPEIAKVYSDNSLTLIIRILGIILLTAPVSNLQTAYVSKKLEFKKLFYSTMGATVISGTIGVILAYKGFGVWALVAQSIIGSISGILILWMTVKWRPTCSFSISAMKELLQYSWNLTAVSLLDVIYTELRAIIIGLKYSSSDLAYYKKGEQFPSLAALNISVTISSVLFPVMSLKNDQIKLLKGMTQKAMQISSWIVFPVMVGLAVIANPLISIILTDKWLFCVPYLRLACLNYGLRPLQSANLQAIKALGQSSVYLRLDLIKKGFGIILLFCSIKWGVFAIAVSGCIVSIFSLFVNIFPTRKLLNFGYKEQFASVGSIWIISGIMGAVVYTIGFLDLSAVFMLFIQITAGMVVYAGLSALFAKSELRYICNMLHHALKR